MLALPDFSQEFVIKMGASSYGIRVVLMQKGQPMAYLSNSLSPRHMALAVCEKELLTLLLAVKKKKKGNITFMEGISSLEQTTKALNTSLNQKCIAQANINGCLNS